MTAFWVVVVLLLGFVLFFVMRPLLTRHVSVGVARGGTNVSIYRDQMRELDADLESGMLAPENHEKARRELEARLLEDTARGEAVTPHSGPARITAIVLAAVMPLGAFGIYLLVGTPAALDPQVLAQNSAQHSISQQDVEAMVEKLAARLKAQPDNPEGWIMLGRSYKFMGRFEDAARAYASAVSRTAPDAELLADYADALGMAQGKTLAGEPEKIIAQALKADPANLKALALAGSAAFEKKDFSIAASYWQKMLALVPAGSEQARVIQANVDEARSLGGIAASGPPETKEASGAPAAPAGGKVSGVVELAPQLKGKVAPTDTVLIYARAAEGSRMPLAIVRKQARELPITFALDDTMAMQPGMTLSKHGKVVVAARVSKAMSATPQPGDFEGTSTPVTNTASGVIVVIDTAVR